MAKETAQNIKLNALIQDLLLLVQKTYFNILSISNNNLPVNTSQTPIITF